MTIRPFFILAIGLLIFGAARLPKIMRNMGRSVHSFKQGVEEAKADLYRAQAESMKEGVALAAELIDSGKAMQTLQALIEVSNRAEA